MPKKYYILPEHSDAQYMSRLPIKYDYNAIYTQMEKQMQLEDYDAQLAQVDIRKINLEFGRISAEDFIRIHHAFPLHEIQEYETKLQTAQTDVEKKSLEKRKQRCQIEIYNCVQFIQEFLAKNGATDPGYHPVSFKEIQDRPSITYGRRMAFRKIAAQYRDNPPELPKGETAETKTASTTHTATAEEPEVLPLLTLPWPEYDGSYKSLLPLEYDYNKIYTQLELQAQLESYPPLYPYHVGEDPWDIEYGRVSADAFVQAHYYDPIDTLLKAYKYKTTDAATVVQRCLVERDNCVQFMQEFLLRKGAPKKDFRPVHIQRVGDDTSIALGRYTVFEDIVSRTQPKDVLELPEYDETCMSRLPKDYAYNTIAEKQLLTLPYKYEETDDKHAMWNGWYVAELFYYLHALCPTMEIKIYEEKLASAKTKLGKKICQEKIDTCHTEMDSCMHFIRDVQTLLAPLNVAEEEDETKYFLFGIYDVFVSILKQLHFGTDLLHVKSRWSIENDIPETDPKNANTIWTKYQIARTNFYTTSKGRIIEV